MGRSRGGCGRGCPAQEHACQFNFEAHVIINLNPQAPTPIRSSPRVHAHFLALSTSLQDRLL